MYPFDDCNPCGIGGQDVIFSIFSINQEFCALSGEKPSFCIKQLKKFVSAFDDVLSKNLVGIVSQADFESELQFLSGEILSKCNPIISANWTGGTIFCKQSLQIFENVFESIAKIAIACSKNFVLIPQKKYAQMNKMVEKKANKLKKIASDADFISLKTSLMISANKNENSLFKNREISAAMKALLEKKEKEIFELRKDFHFQHSRFQIVRKQRKIFKNTSKNSFREKAISTTPLSNQIDLFGNIIETTQTQQSSFDAAVQEAIANQPTVFEEELSINVCNDGQFSFFGDTNE